MSVVKSSCLIPTPSPSCLPPSFFLFTSLLFLLLFPLLPFLSPQSTPYTLMSPNSLLFSFAKFLELKFYCNSYRARSDVSIAEEGGTEEGGAIHCSHCLHRDYIHCFVFGNKLASFR